MNKYALGSIVLGIVLLAILGASRAARWLTQSTVAETEGRIVVLDANDTGARDRGTLNTSQANALLSDDPESLSLAEAGSYIQRQKRVEADSDIARTAISVTPVADGGVRAAGNIAVQPNLTEPTTTTTAPARAIPALW